MLRRKGLRPAGGLTLPSFSVILWRLKRRWPQLRALCLWLSLHSLIPSGGTLGTVLLSGTQPRQDQRRALLASSANQIAAFLEVGPLVSSLLALSKARVEGRRLE